MDRRHSIWTLTLLGFLHVCNGGEYTVVGGRRLRPYTEYSVAVSWTGDESNTMLLELTSARLPGGPYREAQQLIMEPKSTKIASFKIGKLELGNYKLALRSTSGEEISDSIQLEYIEKTYCVFLHTDKTVYQPGDIINFRLLALNIYLKPVVNLNSQLTLKDGKDNIVKSWLNIKLTNGVYSGEISLAEFPVLGDWTFEIELNNQLYTKKVLVSDFILPKFLVSIDTPKHVYFQDEKFNISIQAKQLTGQDVNGELTLTVYPVFFSGVIQPIFQTPFRRVVNISGQIDMELSFKELGLTEEKDNERTVVIEAAVEESLTNRRHNISTSLLLHRTQYAISHNVPSYYKSMLPYTVQMKVSMWEKKNLQNSNAAHIRYSFTGEGINSNDSAVEADCKFNADGFCKHTFNPNPINNLALMNVEIMYSGTKRKIVGIKPDPSSSESLIQAQLITSKPKVNENVQFKLSSTEPLNFFTFYVFGRGDVVYAKTVQVVPAQKMIDFEFRVSQAMAPEATIIINYVKDSKEMVAATYRFMVEGILQNDVRLNIKQPQLEPLGNIDVSISARPNSYVAIMAGAPSPDFSISTDHHYKAGEGSGLSMKQILEEIREFSGHEEIYHPIQEVSTTEIFEKSGVFFMTNSKVNDQYPVVVYEKTEGSTRPPGAGPFAFSYLPISPSQRLHLGKLPTPTWMFTNITLGGDGKGQLGRKLSAEAGEDWAVGAWAVHPVLGLGLASAVKAPVRQQVLFISAPDVARAGETIAVVATLHNTHNEQMSVDITLHNTKQEFKFEELSNEVKETTRYDLYQRQRVSLLPRRSSSAVFFIIPTITPTITGTTIVLEFNADVKGVSENLQHQITIFSDGEEVIDQHIELFDLTNGVVNTKLELEGINATGNRRPVILKYDELYAGAMGSLLSPAIKVLPKLLEIPPASGYHNMLPFMGSILLYQYLEIGNQLPESLKSTLVMIMQRTYQQQLAYRQKDGSFSNNIQPKNEGSLWVTGATAMWLGRAIRITEVNVERNIVLEALQWLSSQQSADGSFEESSNLLVDNSIQQEQVTLTALILQTFIDTKFIAGQKYGNVINKAEDWLARNIDKAAEENWEPVKLAPLAGVLNIVGNPAAAQATQLLYTSSKVLNGRRFWDLKATDNENGNPWFKRGTRNIWVTSWSLQAFISQGYLTEAFEIAKTLVSLLGDWTETSQAVTALPALIALAQKLPQDIQAQLEFRCPNDTINISINKQTNFLVQKQQVKEKRCKLTGKGHGVALASLQGIRRTNVTGPWPRFILDPRVDAISTPYRLQLSICYGFVPITGETISGPVLLKLRLPSGFSPDLDIPALKSGGLVRTARESKLAKKRGEPSLQMILAPVKANERCITLKASRLFPVANERPGVITLVDLTDNSRRARAFFGGGSLSACELCGGGTNQGCGSAGQSYQGGCLTLERQQSPLPEENLAATTSSASIRYNNINVFTISICILYLTKIWLLS